uniref:Uncharacterized protein n=1 Tax=Cacopsylla melanoneura TaxID=428564 RepID=A0A8D9B5R0_9HEMI
MSEFSLNVFEFSRKEKSRISLIFDVVIFASFKYTLVKCMSVYLYLSTYLHLLHNNQQYLVSELYNHTSLLQTRTITSDRNTRNKEVDARQKRDFFMMFFTKKNKREKEKIATDHKKKLNGRMKKHRDRDDKNYHAKKNCKHK